jgi:hypothetical protein
MMSLDQTEQKHIFRLDTIPNGYFVIEKKEFRRHLLYKIHNIICH